MMSENTVGIRELKNRLSEYLRRVKAGEIVIITERGRPVGQILPIQGDSVNRLNALVEAGIVEWNGQRLPLYQPKALNRGQNQLSDLVVEDRE